MSDPLLQLKLHSDRRASVKEVRIVPHALHSPSLALHRTMHIFTDSCLLCSESSCATQTSCAQHRANQPAQDGMHMPSSQWQLALGGCCRQFRTIASPRRTCSFSVLSRMPCEPTAHRVAEQTCAVHLRCRRHVVSNKYVISNECG